MDLNEETRTCDEEWLQFCQNDYGYEETDKIVKENEKSINNSNIENNFHMGNNYSEKSLNNNFDNINIKNDHNTNCDSLTISTNSNINEAPKPSDIYISTKTKIGYFDKEVDIQELFWKIQVIPYQNLEKGVIKKQMKVATDNKDYIEKIDKILEKTNLNWEIQDLSKGKNKYIKKITIGRNKKDLVNYRTKKKGAFYNCFVLYFRIETDEGFKEMHVKFFNTGKIEIPGIKNDYLMNIVLNEIKILFNDVLKLDINIMYDTFNTVLINSNFNCGYYINREILVDILKKKYCLSTSYDPCSYPGIMSKFYYNKDVDNLEKISIDYINKSYNKESNILSFMIFRTGSVLIVGKCNEKILYKIYDFIKNILKNEYTKISQKNMPSLDDTVNNNKIKKKIKKKYI